MAVAAITPDYVGEKMDRLENFHGNQVVYVGWDHHQFFCAPVEFATPPATPFSTLVDELIPSAYGLHPDFAQIDWDKVEWHLNGEPFSPDRDRPLIEQGVDHKSILRMATPGLNGIKGSGT